MFDLERLSYSRMICAYHTTYKYLFSNVLPTIFPYIHSDNFVHTKSYAISNSRMPISRGMHETMGNGNSSREKNARERVQSRAATYFSNVSAGFVLLLDLLSDKGSVRW